MFPHTPSRSPAERAHCSNDASTGVRRRLSYDNWELSPFRHYLKIADTTIISRKTVKSKPKLPSAISGKEYLSNLQMQQEKKENELQDKERKKREREEKKRKNDDAKKSRQTRNRAISNEDDILNASSDDDDSLPEIRNVCGACEGHEDWDDRKQWIGCNQCTLWYHKSCLSEEIANLSERELSKYTFICPVCNSYNKRK